jgi:hypothetical protein
MTGDRPDQGRKSQHANVIRSSFDGQTVVTGAFDGNVIFTRPIPDVHEELAQDLAKSARARHQFEQGALFKAQAPLPVAWTTARETPFDHWQNVYGVRDAKDAPPIDLAGTLDEIHDVYRKVPSRRLVILGQAGAGKSLLALQLLLRLLEQRGRGEPVPELFSLGSWDPGAGLHAWLARQLGRDYPFLAGTEPGGKTRADYFLEHGVILPILDGFDELPGGLHETALERLGEIPGPMVLTSRTAEYRAAVEGKNRGLTGAPAIELSPLRIDDAVGYLQAGGPVASVPAWTAVSDQVHSDGEGSAAGANLSHALSTPLMVGIARDVCNAGPDPSLSPAGLLEAARTAGSPDEVGNYLLDAFLRSACGPQSQGQSQNQSQGQGQGPNPAGNWNPARARRWLVFLARHMDDSDGELAWWRLGTSLPPGRRSVLVGVLAALCMGVTTAVENVIVDTFGTAHGIEFALRRSVAVGVLHGLVLGVAFGIFYLIANRNDSLRPRPVRLRLAGPRGAALGARVRGRLRPGIPGGLAVAALITLGDRLVVPPLGLNDGLGGPLPFAFLFIAGIGLVNGIVLASFSWLEVPVEVRKAVSPRTMLASNRANVLVYLPLWAVAAGLVGGVGQSFTSGPVRTVEAGLVFAGVAAFGPGLAYVLALTAWGQWAALARIWLPLTGQLPWRLLTFLDNACERGILRQVGAVYQFRHARLRDRLLEAPDHGR